MGDVYKDMDTSASTLASPSARMTCERELTDTHLDFHYVQILHLQMDKKKKKKDIPGLRLHFSASLAARSDHVA